LPTLRPGAFSLEFRRSFGFLVPTAEAAAAVGSYQNCQPPISTFQAAGFRRSFLRV